MWSFVTLLFRNLKHLGPNTSVNTQCHSFVMTCRAVEAPRSRLPDEIISPDEYWQVSEWGQIPLPFQDVEFWAIKKFWLRRWRRSVSLDIKTESVPMTDTEIGTFFSEWFVEKKMLSGSKKIFLPGKFENLKGILLVISWSFAVTQSDIKTSSSWIIRKDARRQLCNFYYSCGVMKSVEKFGPQKMFI